MTDPFADLVRALSGSSDPEQGAEVRLDVGRTQRTGIPEFVNAHSKSVDQICKAVGRLVELDGRALVSRIPPPAADTVTKRFAHLASRYDHVAEVLIVAHGDLEPDQTGGRVGIVCAGTSDARFAREAQLVAEAMGCDTQLVLDVGVAGLHRLVAPLRTLMDWAPDVVVVAAGMDGALPSVIAGLVPVPVIGLPVSTGYGHGGDGEAALGTMLQSCAPGLVVVNIDNGVGAGSTAALIANRVAVARNASAVD